MALEALTKLDTSRFSSPFPMLFAISAPILLWSRFDLSSLKLQPLPAASCAGRKRGCPDLPVPISMDSSNE